MDNIDIKRSSDDSACTVRVENSVLFRLSLRLCCMMGFPTYVFLPCPRFLKESRNLEGTLYEMLSWVKISETSVSKPVVFEDRRPVDYLSIGWKDRGIDEESRL